MVFRDVTWAYPRLAPERPGRGVLPTPVVEAEIPVSARPEAEPTGALHDLPAPLAGAFISGSMHLVR
jgi:hypothetical protein